MAYDHRDQIFQAVRLLCLERAAGVAVEHLATAGVPAILLKGPAIAHWLYDREEIRPSRDIDLLVSPTDYHRAGRVLSEIGYLPLLAGAALSEVGSKAQELVDGNGVCIDLHRRLMGLTDTAERCWTILSERTDAFRLGTGVDVRVLDLEARCMHLALHAAQNGPIDIKALDDLQRGLAKVPVDVWRGASHLAEDLGATPAFAAGLRLCRTGSSLADELGLSHRLTVELRLRTVSAPQESLFFERLAATRGVRGKVALFARKVFPTSVFLRTMSSTARHSPLGLLWARISYPVSLLLRLPSAFLAWRRARSHVPSG